jgi:hypothetical protein
MPLYKTGMDMFEKYSKKYNPTVVGTRFGDVKDTALETTVTLKELQAVRGQPT